MSKLKNKTYQIAASKGGNSLSLILSGDLSLNNIQGLKADLAEYLNKASNTKILVKDVDNIDLGFVQLIQSYAWTTLKANNQIDIDLDILPEQQKLLNNAGVKLKF